MHDSVINIHELSKNYPLYRHPIQRLWHLLLPGHKDRVEQFHALKPLSLSIKPGETVGIIGRNGSGKSTLLQLLAGTLTPSQGEVEVTGTISALLELGAGFNPDFTGRENIYLNGALLGISHEEMRQKEESILSFANISEFIDRPLSTYSSGMIVRLAFAVATSIQPQLLIVDEALSVGDEAFQRKCFARIEELRKNGTTILFVSHVTQAVVQLCNRAIWLHQGEMILDGDPKPVTESYHRFLNLPKEQQIDYLETTKRGETYLSPPTTINEDEEEDTSDYPPHGGRISRIELIDSVTQQKTNTLQRGRRYQLRYRLDCTEDAENLRCGMTIKTKRGIELASAVLHLREHGVDDAKTGEHLNLCFEFDCSIYPNTYFINCGVMAEVEGEDRYLHRKIDAMEIHVIDVTGRNTQGVAPHGMTDLNFSATCK